jgi:hypothetical protein
MKNYSATVLAAGATYFCMILRVIALCYNYQLPLSLFVQKQTYRQNTTPKPLAFLAHAKYPQDNSAEQSAERSAELSF